MVFRSPEAAVWLLRCDRVEDVTAWLPQLPEELCRRWERLRHAADRHRFAARHLWSRQVLAQALGIDSRDLVVTTEHFGKPVLPGGNPPVHFSLSQSGSLALLALAAQPVGVDLEIVAQPDRDWIRLSPMVFSEAEMRELGLRGDILDEAVFLRYWTAKEAILKAQGSGLRTPMAGIDLDIQPAGICLRRLPPEFSARDRWRIVSLPLEPGAIGTLALWTGN